MNSDKILISIAAVLVLTVIVFRGVLSKEFHLFKEVNGLEKQTEKLITAQFYPLSLSEKVEVHQTYLQDIYELQDRVVKSTFVKRFVDLQDHISAHERMLAEEQAQCDTDDPFLSFATLNLHSVIADPGLSREDLLRLGCLLDERFDPELGSALFCIGFEDRQIVIEIFGYEAVDDCQECADQISREIFEGDPVIVRLAEPL